MLKMYLISVIIWIVVLSATNHLMKVICRDKDIDYSKYIKNKKKTRISFIIVALIPILRLLFFGTMIFMIGADEEQLDKIFNTEKEN